MGRGDQPLVHMHATPPIPLHLTGLHLLRADPDGDIDGSHEKHVSNRGTNTLVFVPWTEVQTHIINLNRHEMDVFIPD